MNKLIGIFMVMVLSLLMASSVAAVVGSDQAACKEEVKFVYNTHENAWIEFSDGMSVRRIMVYIIGRDCKERPTNTLAYIAYDKFYLWIGEWIPSKYDPTKGTYDYHKVLVLDALSPQKAFASAEEFILNILGRKK